MPKWITVLCLQVYAQFVKELTIVLRDKHALAVLFLMPACFVFLLSLALEDLYKQDLGTTLGVTVVDESMPSKAKPELEAFLKKIEQFDVRPVSDGMQSVTIILPTGIDKAFDEILVPRAEGMPEKDRLRVSFSDSVAVSYRQFVKGMLANYLYEVLLTRLEKRLGGVGVAPKIRPDVRSFMVDDSQIAKQILPNPLQQNVPGWALFAMFFIALPLAGNVIRERSDGTFKRILCYPVSRTAVMVGKLLPYVFINALQFVLMLLVGIYLLPAVSDLSFSPGGRLFDLAVITLTVGLTTTSFAVFIATVSKSVEHASALVGAFVIIFSVIGGIMVPVFAMPPFMRALAEYSPLYWGHQAYLAVMVFDKSLIDVAAYLGRLVAFSGVCTLLCMWRFRWL